MENEAANPTQGATLEQTASKIEGLLASQDGQGEPEEKEAPEPEAKQEAAPEEQAKSDETADTTDETEGENEAEETEEVDISDLHQLSTATGLPVEKILGLKATVKINGQETSLPITDLVNGYQQGQDYTRKTMELSDQRKAFEAERGEAEKILIGKLEEAISMSEYMEKTLLAEYNAVKWGELRASNPAEYAAAQQDYNTRYNQIQQIKAKSIQERDTKANESNHKQLKATNEWIQSEKEKTFALFPEWKSPEKFKATHAEISGMLREVGFNPQEISAVYDHRLFKVIDMALRYHKASKAKTQNKQLKTLPKVLKPGSKMTKSEKKNESLQPQLKQLRKTGHVRDAAKLLENILE